MVRVGALMPSDPVLLKAKGRTYMLYPGASGSHGRSTRSSACLTRADSVCQVLVPRYTVYHS